MRKILAAILVLSVSACVTPTVTTTPTSCSALLPSEWRQGVAGAELPVGDTVGDWIQFGDAQTSRLDIANDHTKSAIGIVERCESRDKQAVERATRRRFLGIF
jgi:hypothetical protein